MANTARSDFDLGKLYVLLVEDEPFSVRLTTGVLRQIGINDVTVARDGAEAVEMLKAVLRPVNLIISDWNMPKMNGLELLKTVRATWPDIPFLMLTGSRSPDLVLAAREQHVNAYIVKPFSSEQLLKKITGIFQKPKAG